MLVTLLVFPVLLFVCFAGVPFFVYIMKGNHLNVTANHALKEAEAAGYVSPAIIDATKQRLASLGMGPVTLDGITYPSFEGSTTRKVYRDDPDGTVTLVIKYPAPNMTKLLGLLGGSGGSSLSGGFYRIVLHGKSEAYE